MIVCLLSWLKFAYIHSLHAKCNSHYHSNDLRSSNVFSLLQLRLKFNDLAGMCLE